MSARPSTNILAETTRNKNKGALWAPLFLWAKPYGLFFLLHTEKNVLLYQQSHLLK